MEKRIVTKTMKNKEDNILLLLNPTESWSPRSLESAISDIESELYSYVIVSTNIPETLIHVVDGPFGKYLRTDHDGTEDNNLDLIDTLTLLPPVYLGNYPSNKKYNWTDSLQGVTHSNDHWFFTQKTKIMKFHVSTNLNTNQSGAVEVFYMNEELSDLGCDHFGDPDYLVIEEKGYLFIPVEGPSSGPILAVFREDEELTYIGNHKLSKQTKANGTDRAGWCAISPIDGILHTSFKEISEETPVFRYEVNYEALVQNEEVVLYDRPSLILKKNGDPIKIPQHVQGGCFSPSGFLFICNGPTKWFSQPDGGIRAFDAEGEYLYKSSSGKGPFNYEFHPGWRRQEPEGITYWNLDSDLGENLAPYIGGQLHAILLNKRAGLEDKIWLKHFRFDSLI